MDWEALEVLPYHGEHVRVMRGAARVGFRCDDCNAIVLAGASAAAVSVWIDGGLAYEPWEDQCLLA